MDRKMGTGLMQGFIRIAVSGAVYLLPEFPNILILPTTFNMGCLRRSRELSTVQPGHVTPQALTGESGGPSQTETLNPKP